MSRSADLLEICRPLLSRPRSEMVVHATLGRGSGADRRPLQPQEGADPLLVARRNDVVWRMYAGFHGPPRSFDDVRVRCRLRGYRRPSRRCRAGGQRNDARGTRLRVAAFQRAGKTAPSWLVANRLRASGFAGILVPSFAPGETDANINLVLWRWGPVPPHRIAVYDPSGRLPRNQLSWLEGSQESLSKLSFGISDGYLPKIPEEGIRRTPAAKDGRLFSENSKNSPRRDETFERS